MIIRDQRYDILYMHQISGGSSSRRIICQRCPRITYIDRINREAPTMADWMKERTERCQKPIERLRITQRENHLYKQQCSTDNKLMQSFLLSHANFLQSRRGFRSVLMFTHTHRKLTNSLFTLVDYHLCTTDKRTRGMLRWLTIQILTKLTCLTTVIS